ncbi:G-protein coupled receptor-associated sorting protein 2 [Dissostichus eleginoides]|uniref:G-protein coupled receptor-associated sorting protein 2 n=1 Tax=Dissostichus eleginoides TaxID=100907 RepID=A0AAD9B2N4_DISEL|nr:G-protein coupled receptor-associated sorting protein 2 [Dissostichus eleginoides]
MKGQVCFLFLLLVCLQRAGSHLPPRLQVGVSGSEGVSQSEGVSPLKVSQSGGVSPLKVSGSGGVSQSGGVSLKTQKGLRRLPGLCRRLRRRRVTLLVNTASC